MKINAVSVAVGLLVLNFFILGQPSATARSTHDDSDRVEAGGSVKNAMRLINGSMRALGKLVADESKRDEALVALEKLQAALATAKSGVPKKATPLEGKAKNEFVAGFRKAIIAFLRASLDLEVALLDGKTADAKKAFETMASFKQPGHRAYK